MCGFEGIHGVVIHGVEFLLAKPVEDVDGQQLEQNVDKACVVLHVHWQAVVRHLTDDPGTTTSALIHLQNEGKRQTRMNYLDSMIHVKKDKSNQKTLRNLLRHSAALHSDVTS